MCVFSKPLINSKKHILDLEKVNKPVDKGDLQDINLLEFSKCFR